MGRAFALFLLCAACGALALGAGPCGPGEARAATYYVDDLAGNDAHSGTAQGQAWKTVARVNRAKLRPGDEVLFRRAGLWRETLMPPASGTASRPLVFGAYGPADAPLPAIYGSVNATGPGRWTEVEPGVWAFPGVAWKPNYFKLRQGGLWHDGQGARQVPDAASLLEPWDFAVDAGAKRVLVRLDHNPGAHGVEIQQRNGVGFSEAGHVTLRDLRIAYCGMGIAIWKGDGWRIEGVVVHDVVEDGLHANGSLGDPPQGGSVVGCRFENWAWKSVARPENDYANWASNEPFMAYGVHVFYGEGWKVEDNEFTATAVTTGTDASAICFDDGSHASRIAGNRIDLGNRLGGPTMGIMLWATRSATQADVVIEGNKLRNLGGMAISAHNFKRYGFTGMVDIRDNIVIGSCSLDPLDAEIIRIWTDFPEAGPVTVEGNVLVGCPAGKRFHPAIRVRASQGVLVDHNVVVEADVALAVEKGATVHALGNVASGLRREGCRSTAHLFADGNCWGTPGQSCEDGRPGVTDPSGLVFDAASWTLRLPPDSPCADIARDGPLGLGTLTLEW